VSSIPDWSALDVCGFSDPFVRFHTVMVAWDLFWGRSVSSQGPLNRFCFSTVRIMSLAEVISIISVVGQVDCASFSCSVFFLISSWCLLAASVLYLLIAFRVDGRFIDISPAGVFLKVMHRWQNQVWAGKLSGLCFSGMHFLWYVWLHSEHARDNLGGLSFFCIGVFCLHTVHCVSGAGFGSRWIIALGELCAVGSVTRRTRPIRACPCSCGAFRVIFWPCRCRCCRLSMGLCTVSAHFWGVTMLSRGFSPCAIRHTSSQAVRFLFCSGSGLVSGRFCIRACACGRAHARHMLMGCVLMAFTSSMRMLKGSVGFRSVVSWRVLWFRLWLGFW